MGCLFNIIKETISFIIGVIVFIALLVGGYNIYHWACANYFFPTEEKVRKKAEMMIDTANLPQNFKLINHFSILGAQGLLANDKDTNQKIGIIKAGKLLNINKDNIHSDKINAILEQTAKNLSYLKLDISKIEVIKKNYININGKNVPFIKIKSNIKYKGKGMDSEGIIGALNDKENQNQNLLLFSFNKLNKYNHNKTKVFVNYLKTK